MAWLSLTKAPWVAIRLHLPPPKAASPEGRPRGGDRRCLEGILCILWTGAPWSALPRRDGSPSTCWRRLKQWEEIGVLLKRWRAFLAQLNDQQKLRWDECFADGRFIPVKRGGQSRQDEARQAHEVNGAGRWCRDSAGSIPGRGNPGGGTCLETHLGTVAVGRPGKPSWSRKRPKRLIVDRGYDSNPLPARLTRQGIEPIIPARATHKRRTHQDGRKLPRYRWRWIVERTFAWLGHFRRLVVR